MGFRQLIILFFTFQFISCGETKLLNSISIEDGKFVIDYSTNNYTTDVSRVEISEYDGRLILLAESEDLYIENNRLIIPITRLWNQPTENSKFYNSFLSNKYYEIQVYGLRSGYREVFHIFIGNPTAEDSIDLLEGQVRDNIKILVLEAFTSDGP